jgi:hypothetical protein
MPCSDRSILRDLASQYWEITQRPVQDAHRDLWRRHNSLQATSIPIYVRRYGWEEIPDSQLQCQEPAYQQYEDWFRRMIYRYSLDDDTVCEPWVPVRATFLTPSEGPFGPAHRWTGKEQGHAGVWDAPIKTRADLAKLVPPHHLIDEQATARRVERLGEAVGDIVPVIADRTPLYTVWEGDISTHLAYLRGLEQMMWDMHDDPALLRELLSFLRDGVLRAHDEAEQAGDWRLCSHENQATAYALELPDPSADSRPVPRSQLWGYFAAQEMTGVGPKLFDQFMLQYQLPIMERFGLVAYGCCEDLTGKIDLLRQIPNLRRIAVSPMADVARCAEQIGTDYVLSYRPSPSDMVSWGWSPARVREILTRDLAACCGCLVDITLKDVETIQGDPRRIPEWVKITREVTAKTAQ